MPAPISACSRVAVLAIVTAIVHGGCLGGGGQVVRTPEAPAAAADPTRSTLEGEWTLVAMETASGSRRVSGYLRYDRFANITVRAEMAADEPAARPPRTVVAAFTGKASPSDGQFEYVGLRGEVDADRLAQDAARMEDWRMYQVAGDTLRLSVRGGGATLVFQRAR